MKLALALALVAAALAGCKHHRPAAGAGSATPPEPAGLTVTSPGAAPRQLLRYHVARGATVAYELDLESHLSAGIDAASSMALHMAQSVEDVAPDGGVQLRTTIRDAALRGDADHPAPVSAAQQVAQLQGTSVVTAMAPDGTVQSARIDLGGHDLPQAVTDQLSAVAGQMRQAAMPLPAVPLGVGAAWQVTRSLDIAGLHAVVTSTVEITAIDGTRVSFRDHAELHAPDQHVTLGGATLAASGITGTAHGTGTIDLVTAATTRDYEAELHAGMAADGEEATPVTMKAALKITPQ